MPTVCYVLIPALRGLTVHSPGRAIMQTYNKTISVFKYIPISVTYIHIWQWSLENPARPFSGCICLCPFIPYPSPSPLSSVNFSISSLSFEVVLGNSIVLVHEHSFLILQIILLPIILCFLFFFSTSQIHPCCWHITNVDGIYFLSVPLFFFPLVLEFVFLHLRLFLPLITELFSKMFLHKFII